MNTEKNMSAREILIAKKKSKGIPLVKYMPINDICEAMHEYASQQNKELIAENQTYISLLDDATKEISKRDKQIEELKEHLRTESDCVEHMKDVEVNYKKEIEELKAENERLKANRKEEIEQAHMSGQRNSTTSSEIPNGIDPSYSEALNYYLTLTPNNNENK